MYITKWNSKADFSAAITNLQGHMIPTKCYLIFQKCLIIIDFEKSCTAFFFLFFSFFQDSVVIFVLILGVTMQFQNDS